MAARFQSAIRSLVCAACATALVACGSLPEERAISGAGIGAGAGAAMGAMTGGLSIAGGALIGSAAGAATGALTSDRQINLGKPVWQRSRPVASSAAAASPAAGYHENTVVAIQQELNRLGYRAGSADGLVGPRTVDAIRRYQRDHSLLVDGRATPELADHIQSLGRPLAQH